MDTEKDLICALYATGLTQREIGARIGRSQHFVWSVVHAASHSRTSGQSNSLRYQGLRPCGLPADAPVWMADLSFRPLGTLQVGDQIIGWQRKQEMNAKTKLVATEVVAIDTYRLPLLTLRTAAGRLLRSPDAQHWLSRHGSNRIHWRTPEPGLLLAHTIEPTPDIGRYLREASYLGGIFDGEGSAAIGHLHIAQSPTANPVVYARIKHILDVLGLPYTESTTGNGFYLVGGRQTVVNFLNWCQPSKCAALVSNILTGRLQTQPDNVLSVSADSTEEVIALSTGTGNYVAGGFCVRHAPLGKRPFDPSRHEQSLIKGDVAANTALDVFRAKGS